MVFQPGYATRIICGDFSFSAYITDWSEPFSMTPFDVTVPLSPDHAREYIAGPSQSTLSLKGFLDPDGTADGQYDQINTWVEDGTSDPVVYGPSGLALGSVVTMSAGLVTKAQYDGNVTAPIGFELEVQNSGQLDHGVSLHDLTEETADGSGTGYDGGAASSNGGVAQLHVTGFSGLSGADIIIEDSANNSTWATLAGASFTTVAGITSERLVIPAGSTVRRYVRATIDVTGTGSITYAVGFARR